MNKIKYIGVFFDSEELPKGLLDNDIQHKHITLKYHPADEEVALFTHFIGKEVTVHIVGYGNDGQNEGLFVSLDNTIPYMGADRPHITLSIADGAKAVNTAYIQTTETRDGIVTGHIGFFVDDNNVVFE